MASTNAILSNMVKRLKEAGDEPFYPLLEEYMLTRDKAKKRLKKYTIDMRSRPRPPGRLSPSSLGGCPRAAAFRFVGVRGLDKRDVASELIFDNGNWFHHRWQATVLDMEKVLGKDRFKVMGIEKDVWFPELYIAGSLDILVRIKVGKQWMNIVIDIKSINSYGFNSVMAEHKPLPSHEQQVTTYAKAAGVDYGLLLYDNKNDQRILPFMFKLDEAMWRDTVEWSEEVISHLEAETIPPMHPDCESGTWLFEKCPYSDLCYKTKEEKLVDIVYRNRKRPWPGLEEAWKRGNEVQAPTEGEKQS